MDEIERYRKIALALEGVSEHPHFENIAFKYKQKVFATLNPKAIRGCVRLSPIDQSAFCSYKKEVMYPVPNKWGNHGWTNINLSLVPEEMLEDALHTAYTTLKETAVKRKKP